MKIILKDNPLNSVIELTEEEKQIFWYKIKVKDLENRLFNTHYYLTENDSFNLEHAKKCCNPEQYCTDEKSPVDQETDRMLEIYLNELSSFHQGDCTAEPFSCMKCHAEEILGIYTTKDLDKYSADFISQAFSYKENTTIDEAISYLENYTPHANWEGWEAYKDVWLNQAKQACEYLKKHKELLCQQNS